MRSRNIKPGFFKNELLGTSDPFLMILYEGLWCFADRKGCLENRPLKIKAEIFPYRDKLDINRYLTELSRLGFIQYYKVDSNEYIYLPKFAEHQRPHHTERDSNIPMIPIGSAVTVISPLEHGENPPDSLIPDSLIPDSLIPDSLIPDIKKQPLVEFDIFYAAYPKHEGKDAAKKAWAKLNPDAVLVSIMLSKIAIAKTTEAWQKDKGKYIPLPATWLNGKRWEDEIPAPTQPERNHDENTPQGWQKPKDYVYPPNEYYGGMPRLLPGETR